MAFRARINNEIRAAEVRVIGHTGENLGIRPLPAALELAREASLDLIEIAPTATPPVVRIMDAGKYYYQLAKEAQKSKKKAREVEVKGIRVRLGTGSHDIALKARKAEEFLAKGNHVQIQLVLRGREKYLDKKFITGRLQKILGMITMPFKLLEDGPKNMPRGIMVTLEPERHAQNKQISTQKNKSDQDRQGSETPLTSKSL